MDDRDELTRPIIGIENRTAQEVFDIMADRIRAAKAGGVEAVAWRLEGDGGIGFTAVKSYADGVRDEGKYTVTPLYLAAAPEPLRVAGEAAKDIVRRAIINAYPGHEWGATADTLTIRKAGHDIPVAQFDLKGIATEVLALIEPSAGGGWRPIETAPQPKWGEPRGYIMLAWTNVDRETGATTYSVGEGYWFENEDGEDGAFWWANTGPGDYAEDQISESITGQLTHWQPLPVSPTPDQPKPEVKDV